MKFGLPGSSRSGENTRKKSSPTLSPRASRRGTQLLVGGAGIGGALQDTDLAGAQVGRNGLVVSMHEAQVRLAVFAERRGHADDERIQSSASSGRQTTGSFSLNEVFSTIGTPVSARNASISA